MGSFGDRARRWFSGRPRPQTPDRLPAPEPDDDELHDRVAELLARELGVAEPATDLPTDVTPARIAAWMTNNQFSYFVDNDGDLGGLWRGRLFFFFLFGGGGESLQVRGEGDRGSASERVPEGPRPLQQGEPHPPLAPGGGGGRGHRRGR